MQTHQAEAVIMQRNVKKPFGLTFGDSPTVLAAVGAAKAAGITAGMILIEVNCTSIPSDVSMEDLMHFLGRLPTGVEALLCLEIPDGLPPGMGTPRIAQPWSTEPVEATALSARPRDRAMSLERFNDAQGDPAVLRLIGMLQASDERNAALESSLTESRDREEQMAMQEKFAEEESVAHPPILLVSDCDCGANPNSKES